MIKKLVFQLIQESHQVSLQCQTISPIANAYAMICILSLFNRFANVAKDIELFSARCGDIGWYADYVSKHSTF